MDTKDRITQHVVFAKKNYDIVNQVVEDKGFGGKGFSAALNYIISMFDELTAPPSPDNGKDKGS